MTADLEGARADLRTIDAELRRSRRSDRFRGVVAIVLLIAFGYMLGVVLPSIRTTTERTDCARAIADETNRLDRRVERRERAARRAGNAIIVYALRLPQGSPVTPELAAIVNASERADDAVHRADEDLRRRPPNQVLVDRTCPG